MDEMDTMSSHRHIDPQIFYFAAKAFACIGCIGLVMLLIYSIPLLTNVNIRDSFNQIKFTTGVIALSSLASLLILYSFLDLIFGDKIKEYRLKKLIAELRKYNALTPEVIAEMNETSPFFPRKDEEHVIQSLALIKLNYHGKISTKQVVGIIELLRNESNYN